MKQYPYTQTQAFPGLKGGLPFVPITLVHQNRSVDVSALVDSGSVVNVLPYDVGQQLGLIWEAQTFSLPVGGILHGAPAFGVLLMGYIEDIPPLRLAFAWTQKTRPDVPVILGQVNFFQEVYPILFNGKSGVFELALYKEL
jgi:hypothetical protein